jgi:ankyrin repeat protein
LWELDEANVLHCAVGYRSLEALIYILDERLVKDVNILTKDQASPVHLAGLYGDQLVIKALVERGADVNLVNTLGLLPIDCALGMGDPECASTFIALRSRAPANPYLAKLLDLQAKFKKHGTPESEQERCSQTLRLEHGISVGNLALCQELVGNGCSVDTQLPSCGNCPPLFAAIREDNCDIVDWLLSMDANPDFVATCEDHHISLWGVVQLGTHYLSSTECLERLLTHALKHKVDSFNFNHNPVHIAVLRGNLEALTTILSHLRKNEGTYR